MEQQRLEKFLKGDLSLFNEFYEENKMSVFYNIMAIVQNEDLAEDVLQETFVKFLENLHKMKVKNNPLGYLFTISRNLSLNEIKKSKKEVILDEYERNTIHYHEERYEKHGFIEEVKKLLNEEEFQILFLHSVNELTHSEISNITKKPLGTITWTYNNAIKKLQKGLAHYE